MEDADVIDAVKKLYRRRSQATVSGLLEEMMSKDRPDLEARLERLTSENKLSVWQWHWQWGDTFDQWTPGLPWYTPYGEFPIRVEPT